jgi:sulfur-oxidizing protein SoxY
MTRFECLPFDATRRACLRYALFVGALTASAAAGLTVPRRVLARRSTNAFMATTEQEVLQDLFGTTQYTPSDAITIEAPLQGTAKSVPLTVSTTLEQVGLIAIVTQANPNPLCATLRPRGASPYVRTRIKMSRSASVTVYVQAGGKLYSASRNVKITAGGYGTSGH